MTTHVTDGADEAAMLRVLFATRWYPSFDLPFRGTFVADLASVARDAGMAVEVASWETVVDSREPAARQGASRTPQAWLDAVRERGTSVSPRSWGAPGISVIRLPAVTRVVGGVRDDAVAAAEAEAESLLAWAAGPAFVRPSVIHAHTGLPDGVAAIALADRLGVPLVTTEHERAAPARLADPIARAAYSRLLDDGRVLLAVSGALKDHLAHALGVDPARIGVLPNPVDVEPFTAASRRAVRDPDELLWVGNRQRDKGSDALLSAVALLRADRPGLRLRMIGRSPSTAEDERLHRLAGELGIADVVSFEPQAPRATVAAAMARAAVFVHPSPLETFGIVAAEAVAAGLPVAAVPSGGVDEVLGWDGRLGVLAADATPEALAAAVGAVLADRTRFDAAEMAASITSRFAPEVVAARLHAIYTTQLEPGPRAGRPQADRRPGGGAAPAPYAAGWSPNGFVVARTAAARKRIGALPPELLAGLPVVALLDGRIGAAGLADGPDWIPLDPMHAYTAARARLGGAPRHRSLLERITGAVRHPRRARTLHRLANQRQVIGEAGLHEDLRLVVGSLATAETPEVVALSVEDVDLVAPLLAERVRLWPGTIRGFVDAWDAAGRPPRPHPGPVSRPDTRDPAR